MDREKALNRLRGLDLYGLAEEDILALHTLIPELIESEDERIRKEISNLYSDIDGCITELLKARTNKDSEAEGKALFKMEGIMVGTLQDLSCIEDYLEKQKEQKPTEWSEEDEERLKAICTYLQDYPRLAKINDVKRFNEYCAWLKSLRPSWKPSEEQMRFLLALINEPNNAGSESCHLVLKSIYDDLKKLM